MSELVRMIEEEDLPEIGKLLERAFGDSMYAEIERLGGMTNHSYRIRRNDGQDYVVRLPGEGTEEMINRREERKSTELACKLGIDSQLLYFDDSGRKVMRFIDGSQAMSAEMMKREEIIVQAAGIFRRLHSCGEDTGVRFEVFEMAELYEGIIRKSGVVLYDDYEATRKTIMEIKELSDSENDVSRVPCHNDSLLGNWVLDGDGKLYLIDWEYAGMNEAMWDLSCLSIEASYNEEDDEKLLRAYFGGAVSALKKKYLIAAKLYVDYLWTLWGLTRVPFDGRFMQEYADMRYERLQRNLERYRESWQ